MSTSNQQTNVEVVDSHHIIEPYVYYRVFAALMVLFVATVAVAFFDLSAMMNWPPANIIVAMAIAIAKVAAIVIYFMHLKFSSRITRVFAVAALFWLALLFSITFADYMARGWIPQPATWTQQGGR